MKENAIQDNKPTEEPTQNPKNTWLIVIIIILTALVIGTGVYLLQQSTHNKEIKVLQQQIAFLENKIIQLQTEALETKNKETPPNAANWDIYQNEKIGWKTFHGPLSISYDFREFLIDFPQDWKYNISENLEPYSYLSGNGTPQEVDLTFPARSLPANAKSLQKSYAGTKVIEYSWQNNEAQNIIVQYFDDKNQPVHNIWFTVPIYNQEKDLKLLDEVLNSFRIVNSR